MMTFKISEIERLHIRSAKRTICGERELRSRRVVNQQLPISIRVYFEDFVNGGELTIFRSAGQRDVEITIYIKGHPVRQRGKSFRINFRLAKRAVFLDL